jgi:uncharacterized protein YbaR (Trm112 family)
MSTTLGLDPLLLEILACPCEAHGALEVDSQRALLVCTVCHRGFPVRDGIPVMLLDEAIPPGEATDPRGAAEA